jgi:hypothetical protein
VVVQELVASGVLTGVEQRDVHIDEVSRLLLTRPENLAI